MIQERKSTMNDMKCAAGSGKLLKLSLPLPKKHHFFLFTDMLVWISSSGTFKGYVLLSGDVTITQGTTEPRSFVVESFGRKLKLVSSFTSNARLWVRHLQTTVSKLPSGPSQPVQNDVGLPFNVQVQVSHSNLIPSIS